MVKASRKYRGGGMFSGLFNLFSGSTAKSDDPKSNPIETNLNPVATPPMSTEKPAPVQANTTAPAPVTAGAAGQVPAGAAGGGGKKTKRRKSRKSKSAKKSKK
jgi:hypothetical protein